MKKIIMCLVLLTLCASPAWSAELMVSAAASLTDAFAALTVEYEKDHPDVTVTMNYAASGALFKQIEQGAPVDLFASANAKWMEKAVQGGFAKKEGVFQFARNSLVLVTPKGNPAHVIDIQGLSSSKVKMIALGTPETVPAGQYAKGALEKMGMWIPLTPKYIFGESVRQVLDYLVRGEVDAGFVYGTDAIKAGDAVQIITEIPLDKTVVYPAAVLEGSRNHGEAVRFASFIQGTKGQAILQKFGFLAP